MYAAHPDPRARDGAYLAIGYREPDRLHYLKRGYYAEHIRRYTEVFGRESVKIVTLDSMMADKALSSTNSILTWLGLPPLASINSEPVNPTKMPKVECPEDLKVELARHFLPEMRALRQEFGCANICRRPSWWGSSE